MPIFYWIPIWALGVLYGRPELGIAVNTILFFLICLGIAYVSRKSIRPFYHVLFLIALISFIASGYINMNSLNPHGIQLTLIWGASVSHSIAVGAIKPEKEF